MADNRTFREGYIEGWKSIMGPIQNLPTFPILHLSAAERLIKKVSSVVLTLQ